MSKQPKLKKGVKYRYLEWGHEPAGMVTVWHADADDGVDVDGQYAQADVLALGIKFDNPYP